MRRLFHFLLFITPIALVAAGFYYRVPLSAYLREKGLLKGSAVQPGEVDSSGGKAPGTSLQRPPEMRSRPVPGAPPTTPAPEFQPLEELVDNWKNVPKRAFPDRVTLRADAEASLTRDGRTLGSTRIPAGSRVVPLSLESGELEIATTASGTTTARVPVDDTDFKEQIRRNYEVWIARQNELASARARETASAPPAPEPAGTVDLGTEPERAPDGSVPLMLESIRSGQVTEIDPARISYWKWLGQQVIDGEIYWAGVVGYQTDTIFGIINTEGKALIRDGKVERWVYSGSEEPIP
ncbi:MAG TPA: hypothetical protein VMN36_16465 [Verrucomicrobiales bacterium]|nr:hypothetical protein [Verrucomicrobiales bacterium]